MADGERATNAFGHFVSWDGGCLFIGKGGVVPVHAHYALQIAFGPVPGIRFRADDREPWAEFDAAIIASRQPHTMDVSHLPSNAVIFVEPETREGRALTQLYVRDGISALPTELVAAGRDALFRAWRETGTRSAIASAARAVVHALTHGVQQTVIADERILRATAYINGNLDRALTLEEVAAEAFLSPSRFRHLFVEETGMALRPYILWRRFLKVWELLMAGESLSSAAHRAGFADAAHLTRTSRKMFGFPPSLMQMAGPLPSGDNPVSPFRERSAPTFK